MTPYFGCLYWTLGREAFRHGDTQAKRQMRTRKHHRLCVSLAASFVLITTASHLHGAAVTFTNSQAWYAAVSAAGSPGTTIFGFNFFPPNPRPAAISNQFAGAGFEFLSQDGQFPIPIDYGTDEGVLSTPLLPNTGQTIRWRFTTMVNAVGWERSSADDTHVYRIFDLNNVEIGMIDFRTPTQVGPIFGGFVSDVPIGFASSFSDNNDQLHTINNLVYAPFPPLLVISRRNTTDVALAWPTNYTQLRLEYAERLSAPTWSQVTNFATIVSNRFLVTLTNTGGSQRYFRLRRP